MIFSFDLEWRFITNMYLKAGVTADMKAYTKEQFSPVLYMFVFTIISILIDINTFSH